MSTFNWRRYLKKDSSTKDINYQTSETTSAIRVETTTGSHLFKIFGFSLTEGIGTGMKLCSEIFTVGGYQWKIRCYPNGETTKNENFVSFYLELIGDDRDVNAKYTFVILQPNGIPSDMSRTYAIKTYNSTSGDCSTVWGDQHFAKRDELMKSKYLEDDAFTLKCTITIFRETKLRTNNSCSGIIIPHLNLNWHMECLLNNGDGTDVTFIVKGESIKAHRWMLAARSAVFKAELFGGMKENWTDIITIEDMEAEVFRAMLYFIYSDSLPDFDRTSDDDNKNQDVRFMAQHMLVAADRYGLERMRLMCEDLLAKYLDESTAATTLILAEQHNCSQLKAACLKFMSSLKVFKAVAQTEEFQHLMNISPSVWKDVVPYLKN